MMQPAYTISSLGSLWLRWAKYKTKQTKTQNNGHVKKHNYKFNNLSCIKQFYPYHIVKQSLSSLHWHISWTLFEYRILALKVPKLKRAEFAMIHLIQVSSVCHVVSQFSIWYHWTSFMKFCRVNFAVCLFGTLRVSVKVLTFLSTWA